MYESFNQEVEVSFVTFSRPRRRNGAVAIAPLLLVETDGVSLRELQTDVCYSLGIVARCFRREKKSLVGYRKPSPKVFPCQVDYLSSRLSLVCSRCRYKRSMELFASRALDKSCALGAYHLRFQKTNKSWVVHI